MVRDQKNSGETETDAVQIDDQTELVLTDETEDDGLVVAYEHEDIGVVDYELKLQVRGADGDIVVSQWTEMRGVGVWVPVEVVKTGGIQSYDALGIRSKLFGVFEQFVLAPSNACVGEAWADVVAERVEGVLGAAAFDVRYSGGEKA